MPHSHSCFNSRPFSGKAWSFQQGFQGFGRRPGRTKTGSQGFAADPMCGRVTAGADSGAIPVNRQDAPNEAASCGLFHKFERAARLEPYTATTSDMVRPGMPEENANLWTKRAAENGRATSPKAASSDDGFNTSLCDGWSCVVPYQRGGEGQHDETLVHASVVPLQQDSQLVARALALWQDQARCPSFDRCTMEERSTSEPRLLLCAAEWFLISISPFIEEVDRAKLDGNKAVSPGMGEGCLHDRTGHCRDLQPTVCKGKAGRAWGHVYHGQPSSDAPSVSCEEGTDDLSTFGPRE
eukprot:gene32042-16572_t